MEPFSGFPGDPFALPVTFRSALLEARDRIAKKLSKNAGGKDNTESDPAKMSAEETKAQKMLEHFQARRRKLKEEEEGEG